MTPQERKVNTSERTEGMIDASASYYQESKLFHAIQNAQALEYDRVYEANLDLALQLSPYTATWALIYWEQANGINPNPTGAFEKRRPLVLSRMVSDTNFSAKLVKDKLQPYDPSVLVDIDVAQCLVTIIFKQLPSPLDLRNCQQILKDIIHAHLGYLFIAFISAVFSNRSVLSLSTVDIYLYNRYYASDIQFDGKRKFDGSWKLDNTAPHRADLHSLAIKSNMFNEYGTVLMLSISLIGVSATYNQDVAVCMGMHTKNYNAPKNYLICISCGVSNTNTLDAVLTKDTTWNFDGELKFDGKRKFNSAIITEQI